MKKSNCPFLANNLSFYLQVAVALVKKLGTRFGRPMNVEAAYFADSLYNAWEMDYKHCRNGILLVISVVDREVCQPFPRFLCLAVTLNRGMPSNYLLGLARKDPPHIWWRIHCEEDASGVTEP